METFKVSELVQRLGSDEDAVRKMAVFKLQTAIGDPSFAEQFAQEGGLPKLRYLALNTSGNTLAYALTSLARLLEVDKGWDMVNMELISKVVELVVTQPLVNILRGATSILVAIVAHPQSRNTAPSSYTGIRALKPVIGLHPEFFDMLVERLSSADHALCANSLQLINALMREAITSEGDSEWPKFIRQLQELGVIKAVYILMQGGALQDLAGPVLEFQGLMKMLLRRWKEVPIELEKPEHRRALKAIYSSGKVPDDTSPPSNGAPNPHPSSAHNRSRSGTLESTGGKSKSSTKQSNPEKWRRLGFATEQPVSEFVDVGFLGMMDLTDFIRRDEPHFRQLLLDQAAFPLEQRCPIARASISVTTILYDHFEVDDADAAAAPEAGSGRGSVQNKISTDSRASLDRLFKPPFLQWSRLHSAAVAAFFRLWTATGAIRSDFDKIDDLVRILVDHVVGSASRTAPIDELEARIARTELALLRKLQIGLLTDAYEEAWRANLAQMRAELRHEALQFVKEQRIRCLLAGAWFAHEPVSSLHGTANGDHGHEAGKWRYVRLSHNRRHLHYADFSAQKREQNPSDIPLDQLPDKIDLTTVSSVVSNTSAHPPLPSRPLPESTSSLSLTSAPKPPIPLAPPPATLITIRRPLPSTSLNPHLTSKASLPGPQSSSEQDLLRLWPATGTLASEWLDGLLMLLSQAPITAETGRLVDVVTEFGLKIRLLNVRWRPGGLEEGGVKVPEREGVGEEFWYQMVGE